MISTNINFKIVQVVLLMWSIFTSAQAEFTAHKLDFYNNNKKVKLPKDLAIKLVVNRDTIPLERSGKKFKVPLLTSAAELVVAYENLEISFDIDAVFLENNLEIKIEQYTNILNLPTTDDGRFKIKPNTFMAIDAPEKIEKLVMLLFVQKDKNNNEKTFKKHTIGLCKYVYK